MNVTLDAVSNTGNIISHKECIYIYIKNIYIYTIHI